jgi:hypothetical protein
MWRGRVVYQSRPSVIFRSSSRRFAVAAATLALIGLGMAGCGLFRGEQREPWRLQAEEACLASKQVKITSAVVTASPLDGPGACGISHPFKVSAFAEGNVSLKTRATLSCPMIPKTDAWLAEVVLPAARAVFGVDVIEMRAGSYACRGRNNQSGAKLSEHSFGNALDIMGFKLADGRDISIVKGWKGSQEEQDFLREVFVGACRHFTTVLGPGADAFHYDHFHLDLARHDPRGQRRICKPVIKFTPLAERGGGMSMPMAYPNAPVFKGPPAPEHEPRSGGIDRQQIDDIDPETDPFSVEDPAETARLSRSGPSRVASPAARPQPVLPARNDRQLAAPLAVSNGATSVEQAYARQEPDASSGLPSRKGDRLDRSGAPAAMQNNGGNAPAGSAASGNASTLYRNPAPEQRRNSELEQGRLPEPVARPAAVMRPPDSLRPPGSVAPSWPTASPEPAGRPIDLSPPGLIRSGSGLY